jgi:hypothetical protein
MRMEHLISKALLLQADTIRESFQTAKPFRHVCLEQFLDTDVAEQLLAEFPVFDPKNAANEMGGAGRKAVNTDLQHIGPTYAKLYEYLCSQPYLDAMSEMLGIPDLLFDPSMFGGGTHENLPGQELDPHVDFNFDLERKLHRRVNLLIYLNKEWDVSWGGAIELHSDPRDWDKNVVTSFNCIFNRCVIFETNEHSWHGFRKIAPPDTRTAVARKCISIYLYTKDRPGDEIAPIHATFYVQRPLPTTIQEGHVLTREDVYELKRLLIRRDGWIKYYQDQELSFSRERDRWIKLFKDEASMSTLQRVRRRIKMFLSSLSKMR